MKRILYTLLGMMLSVGAWAQTSLQEQINSAEAGATITLTEDVTISQTVLINKNITINGDGHTITSSVTNNLGTFYVNVPASNFNITNAIIDGNNTASMAVCAYRGEAKSDLTGTVSVVNNNTGNIITLTNCTVKNFTGYPGSYVGAIYAFSTSTFNLSNCTFSGNTTAMSTNGASGADVWAGAAATVNINGGSYQEVFVNSNASDHAAITISNGATVAELAVCVTENGGTTNQPTITVDGATVTNVTTETGNLIPASAVTVQNGGSITNLPTEYVAQIGTKKYASLAEAVAQAEAGATVEVIADITLAARIEPNKNMTIDLGGHTIKSTATCGNGSAFDVKGGVVTIQNGTIDGTLVTTTECDAITARSGADVTLKELTIIVNSKNGACAYAFDGSKITVESGYYENQTTEVYDWVSSITAMVFNQENVTTQLIEIKGGTFKGYDPALGDDSQVANENHTFIAPGYYTEKQADGSYGLVNEYTVTDGVAFKTLAKPATVATATYSRTMPAGTKYGTVCVPFTLKQGNGTTTPKLYTFTSIDADVLTITEVETVVEPGTPVIFYYEGTGDAAFTTENAKVNTAALASPSGNLVGTYTQQTITSGLESIYFINGDRFHQAKASLTVPAYRAYIKYSTSGARPSVLNMNVVGSDNMTDGIGAVTLDDINSANGIYDINGRQLPAPQKGVNIMKLANGKTVKMIVK